MSNTTHTIKTRLWRYPGPGGWYFVTVPKKLSADIKKRFGVLGKAWGSLAVAVTVGKSEWRTSLFPDKKAGAYLLPIKADVRKKENLEKDATITLQIRVVQPELSN